MSKFESFFAFKIDQDSCQKIWNWVDFYISKIQCQNLNPFVAFKIDQDSDRKICLDQEQDWARGNCFLEVPKRSLAWMAMYENVWSVFSESLYLTNKTQIWYVYICLSTSIRSLKNNMKQNDLRNKRNLQTLMPKKESPLFSQTLSFF